MYVLQLNFVVVLWNSENEGMENLMFLVSVIFRDWYFYFSDMLMITVDSYLKISNVFKNNQYT